MQHLVECTNVFCEMQGPDVAEPETEPEILEPSAPALELLPANSGVPLLALSGSSAAVDSAARQTPASTCSSSSAFNMSMAASTSVLGHPEATKVPVGAEDQSVKDSWSPPRRRTFSLSGRPRPATLQADNFASEASPSTSAFNFLPQVDEASLGLISTGSAAQDGSNSDIAESQSGNVATSDQHASVGACASPVTGRRKPGSTRRVTDVEQMEHRSADGKSRRHANIESGTGGSVCSGDFHAPSKVTADAPQHTAEEEVQMVSLAPSDEGAGLTRQRSHSLPCSALGAALPERPKFNLMVYAGWVPPSLRTSPIGSWADKRLSGPWNQSYEHLQETDRSQPSNIDLLMSSKPLLGFP